MISPLSYLSSSLKVRSLDDDLVEVTVTLPSDHVQHFAQLLDSLAGFVQVVKRKSRYQRYVEPINAAHAEQTKKARADYHSLIVGLFDQYTAQGLSRYEAIKRIGADLREQNHPWSSPDLIRPSLVEAGRGGPPGRPRRQS